MADNTETISIKNILEKQSENLSQMNENISDEYLIQIEQLDILNKIENNISDSYLLQVEQLDTLTNIQKLGELLIGKVGESSEDRMEYKRVQEEQMELLEQIANNTVPKLEKEKKKELDGSGLSLLGWMAGLGAAIGSIVGVITGYVKSLKYFAELAKFFTPEFLKKSVLGLIENISKAISEIGLKFKNVFQSFIKPIETFLTEGLAKLKRLLNFGEESKVGKIFKSLKNFLNIFLKPIEEAVEALKGLTTLKLFDGLKTAFTFITDGLGKFASMFKFISEIVGKLFAPLIIITTIWDTVKGAIEGYEKGGIIGGIQGAIEGFINSLILGPLDMLKDVVSWLATKFGFENVSKALDSFSFEDIFHNLVQTIADGINTIVDWISSIWDKTVEALKSLVPDFLLPDEEKSKEPVKGDQPKEEKSWWNKPLIGNDESKPEQVKEPVKGDQPKEEKSWWNTPLFGKESKPEQVKEEKSTEPVKIDVKSKEEKSTEPVKIDVKSKEEKSWWNTPLFGKEESKVNLPTPESKTTGLENVIPPEQNKANTVYNKSEENISKKEDMNKAGGNTVISAPTVNTSNKTVNSQTVKLPTRNPDSTSSRYIASRQVVG